MTESPVKEKILYLTLKKKWFDMILSGEKKEEYREIKPFWDKRLIKSSGNGNTVYHAFTHIIFTNGYEPDSPQFKIECKSISPGSGQFVWGSDPRDCVYVIELGNILWTKNIKP